MIRDILVLILFSCYPDDRPDGIPFWQASVRMFVFALAEDVGAEELDGDEGDEATVAMHQWELPHRQFEGMWESLYFPGQLQKQLMAYSATSLLFSSRNVDSNLISCNRFDCLVYLYLSNFLSCYPFLVIYPQADPASWSTRNGKNVSVQSLSPKAGDQPFDPVPIYPASGD